MPLLRRVRGDHSIRQFRAAARLRYNEAVRLADSGERLGAIYVAGYAAEMLLKAAYFRLAGWTLDQPITLVDIRNARARAIQQLGLRWAGHSRPCQLEKPLDWRASTSRRALSGWSSKEFRRRGESFAGQLEP